MELLVKMLIETFVYHGNEGVAGVSNIQSYEKKRALMIDEIKIRETGKYTKQGTVYGQIYPNLSSNYWMINAGPFYGNNPLRSLVFTVTNPPDFEGASSVPSIDGG